MCGMAGFFGEGTREELESMIDAIKHRGPDDTGYLQQDSAGLAHARLSIIDTSSAGHQPMSLPDGSVSITFNGEIYNYKELRDQLIAQGFKFIGTSDTEVILWLYKKKGAECFRELVGMFALALYDRERDTMLLVRDRMGEKPLYWTKQGPTVLFASELRGLLALPRIPRKIDLESLAHYLASDYVPTPRTMIEGISKLEPATMLVCTGGAVHKKKYWEPPQDMVTDDFSNAQQKLEALVQRSVTRELAASDVPTGVFLSGGLDSSTIAYFAQKSASRPIDTFSIAFNEPSFDESKYAHEVARHIGSNHYEEMFSPEAALELVKEIPEVFSEPVADASVLPTMLLSRFARKTVKVALGGDGGDELFAGYPTFQADEVYEMYRLLPASIQMLVKKIGARLPINERNFSFAYNLRKMLSSDADDAVQRHLEWLGTFSGVALKNIEGSKLKNIPDLFAAARAFGKEMPGNDEGNKLLYMYARMYLMDQVLVKVDRASMHYALETRAPFLDHTIVDYVFSLPYSYKYKMGTTKYLLKRLMKGKLPSSIVNRKKKGFGVPMSRWLRGPLRGLCQELLSPRALNVHGLFNEQYVEQLMASHEERRADNRKELWNLMVFQLWYQRWMAS